jgi:acyl-CoA thioester hydrolase
LIHQHRVRYHETDQQGFLFNARYLDIADTAMAEYIRDLGWTYRQMNDLGVDPSVVHLEADFLSPARHDDVIDVEIGCARVGKSSFDLWFEMRCGTRVVARLTLTYVNVHAESSSAVALPGFFAEALRWKIAARPTQLPERERVGR